MLSSGQFPGVWIIYADVSEHSVPSSQAGRYEVWLDFRKAGVFIREKFWLENSLSQLAQAIFEPMKMEQIVCSETSAYKIQTPGNYPQESIHHSEHGESLKSRTLRICYFFCAAKKVERRASMLRNTPIACLVCNQDAVSFTYLLTCSLHGAESFLRS